MLGSFSRTSSAPSSPCPSRIPTTPVIRLPLSEAESIEILSTFGTDPSQRKILWNVSWQDSWVIYWENRLNKESEEYKRFKEVKWLKNSRAKSEQWQRFYQGVQLNPIEMKVFCKSCWMSYGHPNLKVGASSTGTLARHKCLQKSGQQTLSLLPAGSNRSQQQIPVYTDANFRRQLLVAIVAADLPFRFVDSDEVRKTYQICRPDVKIPHRTTMRADLDVHFQEAIDQMFSDLPSECKVSIALDGWQSPFTRSYIAIVAYYINEDWEWRERLIGFEHMPESHTGDAMAQIVIRVLRQYNILNRLYCITTDNASNNGTMRTRIETLINELEDRPWSSESTNIPCMAHVIQLVVKAMLSSFGLRSGELLDDEDEEDDREQNGDVPSNSVGRAIQKVRTIAIRINRSSKQKELLLSKQIGPSYRRPLSTKKDIDIRWNSTYEMVLRLMRLRVPINSWLEEQIQSDPSLVQLSLDQNDWKKLRHLVALLDPFARCTALVGSATDSTINHTFQLYNHLFNHLEMMNEKLLAKDVVRTPWIVEFKDAVARGWDVLKKYYSKTGGEVEGQYALAAILDPSKKSTIFQGSDWTPADKTRYEEIFKECWRDDYGSDEVYLPGEEPVAPSPYSSLNALFRSNQDPLRPGGAAPPSNEAEQYLQSPKLSPGADVPVLTLWSGIASTYPTVAKMARDILAVPVAGTGVERVFNMARNVHDYHRAQLSPDTVRKIMIVKHFNRGKWGDKERWHSVEHRSGRSDSDPPLTLTESDIASKATISDDEEEVEPIPEVLNVDQGAYDVGSGSVSGRRRRRNDSVVDSPSQRPPQRRRRAVFDI